MAIRDTKVDRYREQGVIIDIQNTNANSRTLQEHYWGSYKSEKKKSLFMGGGPAVNPLGISTLSPERSREDTSLLHQTLSRKHSGWTHLKV